MLKAVADARSTKRRRTDIVDDALRQPLVGRRKKRLRKSRELKGKIFLVIQNKPGPGMGGAPLKTRMPVSYCPLNELCVPEVFQGGGIK
jgi:hypothetical protein